MSESYPPLSPHKNKSWSEWIDSVESVDHLRGNEPEENQGNVTRLPRTDIELYGTYPKMEPRVYVVCNCCSKVIRPCDAAAHLNQCFYSKDKAEETQPETPSSSNAVKKKSSQTKSKKKSILPKNVPPPPLFPWFSAQCAKEGAAAAPSSLQETSPVAGASTSGSSSSSRHKKAKKQTSKGAKNADSEKHHPLTEGEKGAHKSSARSSHQGSWKKIVSSKSKSSHHHAGGEKNGVKPILSEFTPVASVLPSETVLSAMEEEATEPVTVEVETTPTSEVTTATTYDECKSEPQTIVTTSSINIESTVSQSIVTTSVPSTKPSSTSDSTSVQDSVAVSTVPIVLMPMSPVAVVSPIQVIQLSVPVLHLSSPQQTASSPLPTQPIVVSIPDQPNGVKLYNTHPKPLIMPTMANRKIGNTILLQNQRLEQQRNKIDVALNCKTFSLLNSMHKPNILKCGGVRMNMKRPAPDKLVNAECKQTRLMPDVNGFILHADVSESAEAPQSDNSIHEKIRLMNLK